ncbi:MAG: DTW domain-containing protein [Halobacteriovorax sp.]|nr:DTW domain-containing protein [Halobacteriovorax sp.]|tara:strand:- start:403 stop:1098 length:696 start_codon:yes stop_codon:yes gene_type:complete
MTNLQQYLDRKKRLKAQEFTPRENCGVCGFSKRTCYCHKLKPFDPKITFAILIHKLEIERKIATGTMSHLILENSHLIPGFDYTLDETVNNLVNNPEHFCVVMYPGRDSLNLSSLTSEQKKLIVPKGKKLVIIVVDGTWCSARHTMRLSQNIKNLPRISFSFSKPSRFRIRKQPKIECCASVEAIHRTIELLGDSQGYDPTSRKHDNLLEVFDFVVETQIAMMEDNGTKAY